MGAKPKSAPKTPARARPSKLVEEEDGAWPAKGTSKGRGKGGKAVRLEDRKRKWKKDVVPQVVGQFRTPCAHRRGHMSPKTIGKFVRGLPAVWKVALDEAMSDFKTAKVNLSLWDCNPDQAGSA